MVRIVTDSTCDISPKELKSLGVEMLPLTVYFGEQKFVDGYELTSKKFFEMLEDVEELPHTAQVSPWDFEQTYRKIIDEGDEIVSIHISEKLSGTVNSARSAAQAVDSEKIFCVDGNSASFGFAVVVRAAVRMRDEGMSAKEIAEKCQELADRSRIIAYVSTLKYLKMGGRLSTGAALIGSAVGIRLIIEVKHGNVEVVGKVRGEAAGLKAMKKYIEKRRPDYEWGVTYGHANVLDALIKCMEYFRGEIPEMKDCRSFISGLGPVVGTHVGPGMIAVGYIVSEEDKDK